MEPHRPRARSARSCGGERPVIRSDGSFVRDYFYVEDAADGVLALAEAVATRPAVAGEAFNFAPSARLTVLEIVDRILRADGLRPRTRRAATTP